jgi:hypothetical protein
MNILKKAFDLSILITDAIGVFILCNLPTAAGGLDIQTQSICWRSATNYTSGLGIEICQPLQAGLIWL